MIRTSLHIAVLLFAAQFLFATTTGHAEVVELKVGIVPQYEQRKLYRIWRPILDQLETLSGLRLTLVGTSKIPEFEQHLLDGKFDVAYMNPYHLIRAHSSQGYIPVANDGNRKLKGILVVNSASNIKGPAALNGQVIAFPSPNALGSSLLMRAELAKKYNVTIKPKYVKTHSSVYLHVAKQLVAAGGGVRQTFETQDKSIRDNLRIIYETRGIAPHPIAVHPRIPMPIRDKLVEALLTLGKDPEGKLLLAKIPIEKIHKTSFSDYRSLNELGLSEFYIKQN